MEHMQKTAFIFSITNLFMLYAQLSLRPFYDCKVLNMRYTNEDMSKNDFLIQQIKELFDHEFYEQGLIRSKNDISFTSQLIRRIDDMFKQNQPSIVFLEMKTMDDAEWMILEHIHSHYNVSIAVFIEEERHDEQMIKKLLKSGVREIIPRLDDISFKTIARRNR